jgi:hypothetical protein
MDLRSDNLSISDTGIPYGEEIDKAASQIKKTAQTAGNIFKGIKVNAKTKSAQQTADQGQYWTLRPYLKNLIMIPQYILDQVKGQGITYYAVLQLPEQGVGANNTDIINLLKQTSGKGDIYKADPSSQAAKPEAQQEIGEDAISNTVIPPEGTATTVDNVKKYIPYAIGLIVVAIIVYYFLHKRK